MTESLLVNEQTSSQYRTTLKDQDGNPVPAVDISALTLTLYDRRTGSVINGRSAQSVKDTNGGTLGATDGLFTMTFAPVDAPIVTPAELEEHHVAVFEAAWTGGGAKWEVHRWVRNLALAPAAAPDLQDNALLTLAEGRLAIGSDQADGAVIAAVINAVSDLLERETGRRLRSRTYTALRSEVRRESVDPRDRRVWRGLEWPITLLSAVTINQVAQTIWMPGDPGEPDDRDVFVLDGPDPIFARDRLYRRAGWCEHDAVTVTYTAGYAVIPSDLREAAKTLCRERWVAEQRQLEAATAVTVDGQSVAVDGYRLLRRVRELAMPYKRWAA